MTISAVPGGDGLSAVQSRISEIQSRFMPTSSVAFGTLLANQLGGVRRASSFSGEVPNRLPAGLSPAVDIAQRYLGVPYVWGGESPAGFDCSGLVQHVYGQLGVDLPRVAADQARAGQPVASLAEARPGDLLAFHDPVDHIGIYAGNGLMVVAPKTGDVVKVQAVYDEPTAIRRVLPSGTPVSFGSDLAAQRSILLSALGAAG
jgi:cell wall-associated NlpC family hydrolase